MRHRVSSKRLKRSSGEFKSLLKNMSAQLFERGSVTTTLPKAKILRPFAEKLVTLAKDTSFSSVKRAKQILASDSVVRSLFGSVAPKFLTRKGGYTRIVKLGRRPGDNAPKARLEFVENVSAKKEPKARKLPKAKVAKAKVKKVKSAKN